MCCLSRITKITRTLHIKMYESYLFNSGDDIIFFLPKMSKFHMLESVRKMYRRWIFQERDVKSTRSRVEDFQKEGNFNSKHRDWKSGGSINVALRFKRRPLRSVHMLTRRGCQCTAKRPRTAKSAPSWSGDRLCARLIRFAVSLV